MITSLTNKEIKNLFKLKIKKNRDLTNEFLVFGEHLIEEAIKTNNIVKIYTTNDTLSGEHISKEIMEKLKDTKTSFERVAVVRKPDSKPYSNKILILDDIQDPLNMGSLIRTAAGFNFSTVIASNKSADFYNEKTIRATQGTLFYTNLIRGDLASIIADLKLKGYQIVVADLVGNIEINALKSFEKIALVLGNEGAGISEEIKSLSNYQVTIKTNNIESLNVGHAGAILMYEVGYE